MAALVSEFGLTTLTATRIALTMTPTTTDHITHFLALSEEAYAPAPQPNWLGGKNPSPFAGATATPAPPHLSGIHITFG